MTWSTQPLTAGVLYPAANRCCAVQGNINLIEAAVRHGVKKFVLVTSIGTGGILLACAALCCTVLRHARS